MHPYRVIHIPTRRVLEGTMPDMGIAMNGRLFIHTAAGDYMAGSDQFAVNFEIGINDREGLKIYEDDIVEADVILDAEDEGLPSFAKEVVGIVFYDKDHSGYSLNVLGPRPRIESEWYPKRVVGNRHLHPELVMQFSRI